MTRLIGARCKHCKVLSRGVLIAQILLGNLKITSDVYSRSPDFYVGICYFSTNKINCVLNDGINFPMFLPDMLETEEPCLAGEVMVADQISVRMSTW